MAHHKQPYPGFFDDEATRVMSAAFGRAWRVLEAGQAGGCDERSSAIMRRGVAAAVLELAAFEHDCEMIVQGAIDRVRAASRFRDC
jgi:hypothetical protein